MIDPSLAFRNLFEGFSIWTTPDGRYQCSLKMVRGGFQIGYGYTPEEAWDDVWSRQDKPKKTPRRRSADDLA